MKKIFVCMLSLLLLTAMFVSCGNSTAAAPDYEDAASFEAALNNGEDLTGKTVKFTCEDFKPDSAFGYNLTAGEHLNFCSTENPGVEVGDTITVKITEASSFLGSWILSYEKQ